MKNSAHVQSGMSDGDAFLRVKALNKGPKMCQCGHDRNHYAVSAEAKYSPSATSLERAKTKAWSTAISS
jgi:hypothetical protein